MLVNFLLIFFFEKQQNLGRLSWSLEKLQPATLGISKILRIPPQDSTDEITSLHCND